MDAITSGFRTNIDDRIADTLGFGEKDVLLARDAERERVDKGVLRVTGLEGHFAADGGHAETIAVVRDPPDDPVQDAPVCRLLRRYFYLFRAVRRLPPGGSDFAKAQGIENGDGSRTHGENIAEDPADSRRSSLEGFNVAWMIVGFDFEGGNQAVANIDDTGIFAGSLNDQFAARGQAL